MRFLPLALFVLLPVFAQAQQNAPAKLQAGDVLSVRVPPQRAAEMTIDRNGQIQLATYGKFTVAGMTAEEAQEWLRNHLRRYIRNTQSVQLRLLRAGRLVLVTGQVNKPGVVRVGPEADVWQVISAAGGPATGADLTRVTHIRNTHRQDLDVGAYLSGSQNVTLPIVRSGDTVFVPTGSGTADGASPGAVFLHNENVANKVFVLGAVEKPGMYNRPADLDAIGALALAGGPRDEADLSNLRVITRDGTLRINATGWLNGLTDERPTVPAVGGAIVYVPTRGGEGGGQIGDSVTVIGSFARPGQVAVPAGTSLLDAVGLAGGPGEQGDMANVRLVQRGARFTLATEYDLEDFVEEGGYIAMVRINASDVVYMGREVEVWNTVVQVVSDIAVIAAAFALFSSL